MVPLKEKLLQDLKDAMRDKDVIRKNTVQLARSAVLQYEKDNRTILDDNGVIEIMAKELKKRRDALPEFVKSGRQDLIDALEKEILILLEYLPKQLSEEEVCAIVNEVIGELQPVTERDMGKIMQAVMPRVKSKADGKTVSLAVRKYFSAAK